MLFGHHSTALENYTAPKVRGKFFTCKGNLPTTTAVC